MPLDLPRPLQAITNDAAAALVQNALQPLEQRLAAEAQQRVDGLTAAAARSDVVAAEAERRACELEQQLVTAAAEAQRRTEALGAELAALQAQQGQAADASGASFAGLKAQVCCLGPLGLSKHALAGKRHPLHKCSDSAANTCHALVHLSVCRWTSCRVHTSPCKAAWLPTARQAQLGAPLQPAGGGGLKPHCHCTATLHALPLMPHCVMTRHTSAQLQEYSQLADSVAGMRSASLALAAAVAAEGPLGSASATPAPPGILPGSLPAAAAHASLRLGAAGASPRNSLRGLLRPLSASSTTANIGKRMKCISQFCCSSACVYH